MRRQLDQALRQNWAGNFTYSARTLHLPKTVDEAQDAVRQSSQIRALGSRHCFNTIADSTADQISLRHMNRVVDLDEKSGRVTVEAGIRYGDLCPDLHQRGYALHNLASLPHINIVGACATATHGSGVTNANLAAALTGVDFINADGELVSLSRDNGGIDFAGAAVGLGAFGIVVRLTLEVEPAFDVTQHVYLDLPYAALDDHLSEILSSGYSVSLFTTWQSDSIDQVWIKQKVVGGETSVHSSEFFGARSASSNMHPIPGHSGTHCTQQMGVPGPWFERLPHFRMEFTPSSGKELQSEYFVPREHSRNAIGAIRTLGDQIGPFLMISEIRTIAADDFWLSPCYERDMTGFHFTWKQEWDAIRQLLPRIEACLEPFGAVPHWGKLFTMPAGRVRSHYAKLQEFRALAEKHDPEGKFRNAFLDEYVF